MHAICVSARLSSSLLKEWQGDPHLLNASGKGWPHPTTYLIDKTRGSVAAGPYCKSPKTELRSQFGSTACKSLCWCTDCRQPFEMSKAI